MSDAPPVTWSRDIVAEPARPPLLPALLRGMAGRCPCCGRGRAFAGFLRVEPHCRSCGAALGELRADDLPPWLVAVGLGHVIIPLMLLATRLDVSATLQAAIFLPTTAALALALLRPAKGASLGLLSVVGRGCTPGP